MMPASIASPRSTDFRPKNTKKAQAVLLFRADRLFLYTFRSKKLPAQPVSSRKIFRFKLRRKASWSTLSLDCQSKPKANQEARQCKKTLQIVYLRNGMAERDQIIGYFRLAFPESFTRSATDCIFARREAFSAAALNSSWNLLSLAVLASSLSSRE